MTKKQYLEALKRFPDLVYHAWLELLPVRDQQGKPLRANVPIVLIPAARYREIEEQVNRAGFRFADSTVWYIEGYHYPKGYWARAFVRTPEK